MKVSELRSGHVYAGADGSLRFLKERRFDRRHLTTQHDVDTVVYQRVMIRLLEQEQHQITARAFARWAVQEVTTA